MNDLKQFVLANLSLAISAHNSQPFKLKIESFNQWCLKSDPNRALPVADPMGKDHEMSAGAYLELIDILLRSKGHKIQNWSKNRKDIDFTIVPFDDSLAVSHAQERFELAKKRFSFRGQATEKKMLTSWPMTLNSKYVTEPSAINGIAKIYDDVNYRYLISPGYVEELYDWMRFSKGEHRYFKDGLNTEAMGLSSFEAIGAAFVMKPKIFRTLDQIGVSKLLVLEKDKTASASALMVIFADTHTDYVEQGRLFFRSWLDMTAQDFYGCPMSLLTDADKEKNEIYSLLGLNPSLHQLINVLRACVLPKNYTRYRSARLDVEEITE